MIETASNASLTVVDPRISSIDVPFSDDLGEPDEEILSSADIISMIDALPSRGARRPLRGATPAAPVADPLIGRIVADRYRIVEPIGRGGMGIVYKVEHVRIGKLLAMKLLTGELSQSPEIVRRFKREALTVSKLASPNTVQVFDFGVSDGLTYLVMELAPGDDLGRVLRAGGPIPASRLGKIVIQVCSSLAEAHQKGIVHRDIKPENIMLVAGEGGADVAKMLDFGLAKLREAEGLADVTIQGTIMGTPYYMAPEQVRGEDVDARTDVYGVGALMYRLLTGFHPFSATSPMAVLSKQLNERPIPPAERAPELGIPPGMSRLVMRALSKDPAERFQRIEDLQAGLVEELRAAGSPSVDRLLDPERLRRDAKAAIATRDEVDAYERKLRRTRVGAAGIATALVFTAIGSGAGFLVPREAKLSGAEIEPNNTAAEATPIPLGRAVTGRIGQRLDASHGDRDFYAIDVPARVPGEKAFLKLEIGALPTLATCAMLYRPGFADAVGQYCAGRPGRDLVIPAIRLEPGRYLLAVLQDLDSYGGAQPLLHETISDTYTVRAESVIPAPGTEIEPNDQVASATELDLGAARWAAIGWARDEDVFCLPEGISGPIRWSVRPGLRDGGALEATPLRGSEEGAPVRILDPWQSAAIAQGGAYPRCLRVRLAKGGAAEGREPYVVEANAAP